MANCIEDTLNSLAKLFTQEPKDNVIPLKLVEPSNPIARVRGIDVSHYEPPLDWSKAKAFGVEYMFTKATEGAGHIDSLLNKHVMQARAAGVLTGAYHFFHANVNATAQANLYLDTVKNLPLDFPHVLDWESSSGDGVSADIQATRAKTWLDIVEKATGRTPIIYGGESHLRELRLKPDFARYPLWLAHYGVKEASLHVPAPWGYFTFWQYTDAETVPGLEPGHHVDANWFRGSVSDLLAFAGKKFA